MSRPNFFDSAFNIKKNNIINYRSIWNPLNAYFSTVNIIIMKSGTYRPSEGEREDEVCLRSGGVGEGEGVAPERRTVDGAEGAGPRWRHVALILFETNVEVCEALEMAHISMPLALFTTTAVSILELATMIYHGQDLQFEVARTEHALKNKRNQHIIYIYIHTIRSQMSHTHTHNYIAATVRAASSLLTRHENLFQCATCINQSLRALAVPICIRMHTRWIYGAWIYCILWRFHFVPTG